ncbi:MAG: shikimate kinase [Candidatus Faecousia sp.]|nr:shikimate kinase [Candidatus Faecousia sp.]
MKCGLLGGKLGHSFSPQIHGALADYRYTLWEKSPEELDDFLKNGDFTGLNVTIPYKKDVMPYCAELSEQAKKVGAVNTIVRRRDGTLLGHNTDYFGFAYLLKQSGIAVAGKKCLVLGTGGASVTVQAVLREQGAKVVVLSRSGPENYDHLERHADAALIVNATPVGMYPNTGVSPIKLIFFPNLEGVLDLIYNPARTQFLLDAEKLGVPGWNGLSMLVAQAKESAEWFTEKTIPDERIEEIYTRLRRETENLVIIGMPGSGKTTVGRLLAQATGKIFVDVDEEIIRTAGMSISEIFAASGEAGFREIETSVLCKLGKGSGQVIATGGGCVTRPENYSLLHQNGRILRLRRDIGKLPKDGRPLSLTNDLSEMAAEREPLYAAFADLTFDNNDALEHTLETIVEAIK